MSNFRDRITIQEDQAPIGASVGVTDWNDVIRNVPCNLFDVAGRERFRGVQLEATTEHMIEMRYLTQIKIKPDMRARDTFGRVLDIKRVVDKQGRRRYLYLLCSEVV